MNKQILLLVLYLVISSNIVYADISRKEAYAIAASWFKESGLGSAKEDIKIASTNHDNEGAYYIFNHREGAFVIVSGISDENEIIGYSKESQWDCDNEPPFLLEVLANYKGHETVKTESRTRSSRQNEQKLLKTANWGQYNPYNAMLDNNYPIGCVATAIAIVLRYYESPLPGKGTHSYQTYYDGKTYSFDFNRNFDWSKMPLEGPYTDEEATAISELCFAAAVASDMNFAPGGSGATARPYSIQEYFNYSSEIISHRSEYFGLNEIEDLLYEEIDNGRVVIFSGGSHCFVCDGYSKEFFHFNFGWNGSGNGFFRLTDISPVPAEYPYLSIITGIHPAEEINEVGIPWRIARGSLKAKGISVNSDKIEKGGRYNFFASDFQAHMEFPYPFDGEVGLALFSSAGEIKEIIYSKPWSFNCFYGDQRLDLTDVVINCDLDSEDYICLVGRACGVSRWSIIPVEKGLRSRINVSDTGMKKIPMTWDFGFGEYDYYDYAEENNKDVIYPGCDYSAVITFPEDHIYRGCLLNGFPHRVNPYSGTLECHFSFEADHGVDSYTIRPVSYKELEALNDYEIMSENEGTLFSSINHDDFIRLTGFKIAGEINDDDIELIQALPNLKNLDIKEATITGGVANKIPDNAFYNNQNIERIILPESVTTIGALAFCWSGVKHLHFGPNVKEIMSEALRCEELEEFYVEMPKPIEVFSNCFESMNLDKVVLYVPKGTKNLYKNSPYAWREFKNIEEVEYHSSVRTLADDGTFSYVSNRGSLIIRTEKSLNINVLDMNGKVVISDKVSGVKSYDIESGFYILTTTGGNTHKLAIP